MNPPAPAPAPLRGWVSTFFVDYHGKKLGPYHVRKWKTNGKVRIEYIKPHDLARVRAACQAYREKRQGQIECARNFARLAGNLNYLERVAKRADRNPLRPQDYEFLHRVAKQGIEIPGRPCLRTPNPQHRNTVRPQHLRTKPFMYPSHTKMKKELFDHLKSAIDKPIRDKRNAESGADKLTRWLHENKTMPMGTPNTIRTLSDSLPPNHIVDFVESCIDCRPPLRDHEHLAEIVGDLK